MTTDRIIRDVLANFDMNRVHKAMKTLDWVWWNPAMDDYAPPTIDKLHATARNLLTEVIEKGLGNCSTGGFTAFKETGEMGQISIGLEFRVETASADFSEDDFEEFRRQGAIP